MPLANEKSDKNKNVDVQRSKPGRKNASMDVSAQSDIETLKYLRKIEKKLENIEEQYENMQTLLIQFEDRIMAEIEKIEKSSEDIKSEVQTLGERVSSLENISNDVAEMKTQIKNLEENEIQVTDRVNELESKTFELDILKNEIVKLKIRVQRQENTKVAADLRINGIPYYPNENLSNIFTSICQKLSLNMPAIKSIYRLQNQNNKAKENSQQAVIMVKMMSPYDKNLFLKTLSEFRKLNKNFFFHLNDIGYNSPSRFYVNENLVSLNYKIFQQALKLKKENTIYSTFTNRGLVYIKQSPTDQPLCIYDFDELNSLFPRPSNEEANITFQN